MSEKFVPTDPATLAQMAMIIADRDGVPVEVVMGKAKREIDRWRDTNEKSGFPFVARLVWDERLSDSEIVQTLRHHKPINDLHWENDGVSRLTAKEDLQIIQRLLVSAQVASCTCCTKTPDIAFHEETCTYRLAVEAAHLVTLMQENEGGVRAPCADPVVDMTPETKNIWGLLTTALNDGVPLPVNTSSLHPVVVKADGLIQEAMNRKLTIPDDPVEAVAFLRALA